MKILIVQNTDWIKRNPAQQHHLAEMLSLRGHEIRVIDYEILWRNEDKREVVSQRRVIQNVSKIHQNANVTVIRPSIIKIPIIDYISMMISQKIEIDTQVREFKPDIIVSLGIAAYNAGKASQKYKIPFVYYWIDVSHRLIPIKVLQPIGWIIERKNLKMADRILAINKKLKAYLLTLGASPEGVRVLGAGIDLSNFNCELDGRAIRSRHGIKNDDFVLFFMGWLYHFSGLKELAANLKDSQDSQVKLLIVGDGDCFEDLLKLQQQYHIEENMILCGKKAYHELPEYIAASDVCLLPSYPWEPIMQDIVPIKLYEYMAMGKPVISTKLPGVMAEFGEGNGIEYSTGPEDVLVKALELKQNKKFRQIGAISREYIKKFSWDMITNDFEEILKACIRDNVRSG